MLDYSRRVIFKRVGDGRPYPDHGLTSRGLGGGAARVRCGSTSWSRPRTPCSWPPLLDEDSTFFGDLFAHVVWWRGEYYLEDGLHRALRAALQQRNVLHARVHVVEAS